MLIHTQEYIGTLEQGRSKDTFDRYEEQKKKLEVKR